MSRAERTPLLPSDRPRQQTLRARLNATGSTPEGLPQPATSSEAETSTPDSASVSTLGRARLRTHALLTSRAGHYSVLLLVTLDVACIFADFLISLYSCEHFCRRVGGGGGGRVVVGEVAEAMRTSLTLAVSQSGDAQTWETVQTVLGNISIAFSTLFLLELLLSLWAFGRTFFYSKFHVFDALVIVAGFVLDVCLKGVLEEVGSVVVVLRFWRVFKLLEELGDVGAEEMEKEREEEREVVEGRWRGLEGEMEGLRRENEGLRRRLGMRVEGEESGGEGESGRGEA